MRSGLLKNYKITFIATALAVLVLCISIAVQADTSDNASYTANGTIDVSEYSRKDSTIRLDVDPAMTVNDIDFCNDPDVTCSNLTVGDAKASFTCHGVGGNASNNGWWGEPSYSGTCWTSLDVYYYFGTPDQVAVDLLGSSRNSPSHIANEAAVAPTTSSCLPASQAKGVCLYEANAGIITNTGDDMFALSNGAQGYIEYPALGGLTNVNRLTYISRNGGIVAKNMMLPSGPPGDFSDYTNFITAFGTNPTAVSGLTIKAEPGCYPLEVTSLCQGDFTIPPPSVNGVCGTADGNNYADAVAVNAAGICSAGTPVPATIAGAGPWNWSCDGLNGGANAACSAAQSIDGVCASLADYQISEPATNTANACNAGTFLDLADTPTQYEWSCEGTDGGADSPTCTASRPTTVVGLCKTISGSSATQTATSTATGCDAGTYADDASDTAALWKWDCAGAGTPVGTTANCTSIRISACSNGETGTDENATCGSAHGGFFASTSAVNSAQRCLTGIPTSSTLSGSTYSWTCDGASSGTDQSCSASESNGVCKAYAGTYSSQPASDDATGCTVGTFAERSDSSSDWRWRCSGLSGGNNVICTASKAAPVDGICRTYAGTYSSQPASDDATGCTVGTFAERSDSSSEWRWRCNGLSGGNDATCPADKIVPVDGRCGAADGQQLSSSPPGSDLCYDGTASLVAGANPWTWTCTGIAGGSDDACLTTPVGVCGPAANGTPYKNKPNNNLCDAGFAQWTPGSPTDTNAQGTFWVWRCDPSSGASTNCSAPVKSLACGSTYSGSVPVGFDCTSNNVCTGSLVIGMDCVSSRGSNGSGFLKKCIFGNTCNSTPGQCGVADGVPSAGMPTTGLCAQGFPADISSSAPWTWKCDGIGGSYVDDYCNAPPAAPTVNGSCGSADGTTVSSAPSSNLCSTGSASSVTGSGPWNWLCNGTGTPEGTPDSCSASMAGLIWACTEVPTLVGMTDWYLNYHCQSSSNNIVSSDPIMITPTTPDNIVDWVQTAPTAISPYTGAMPSTCTPTGLLPATWDCY